MTLSERLKQINWPWWRLSDIQADTAFLRTQASVTNTKFDDLKERVIQVAANFDKLDADLNTLAAGYVAQQAIIKTQADALASADADKAQAVADAIAADDAIDQAAVDAADGIAQAVLNPAPPADGS